MLRFCWISFTCITDALFIAQCVQHHTTVCCQPHCLILEKEANNYTEEQCGSDLITTVINVRYYFDFSVCWSNCYLFLLIFLNREKRTAFNMCPFLIWATTHFQAQQIHSGDIWFKKVLFLLRILTRKLFSLEIILLPYVCLCVCWE